MYFAIFLARSVRHMPFPEILCFLLGKGGSIPIYKVIRQKYMIRSIKLQLLEYEKPVIFSQSKVSPLVKLTHKTCRILAFFRWRHMNTFRVIGQVLSATYVLLFINYIEFILHSIKHYQTYGQSYTYMEYFSLANNNTFEMIK